MPTSEPRASPSGRTCAVTRKRSCKAIRSASGVQSMLIGKGPRQVASVSPHLTAWRFDAATPTLGRRRTASVLHATSPVHEAGRGPQVVYSSTRNRPRLSRTQAIVSSSAWSSEYCGCQPQSSRASAVPASRRPTSLAAGRTRSESVSTRIGRAEPGRDPLDQLADREVLAPADVDDPADRGVAAGDRDEARDGVLDVGQVATRVQAPQADAGPGQGLADDRRDDRAGRLPRAERVEGPEDRHGQAEGAVIALAQGVGADLGRRVGGLPLERVPLVDRHVERRAVDLGRRGQDDPLQDARWPGRRRARGPSRSRWSAPRRAGSGTNTGWRSTPPGGRPRRAPRPPCGPPRGPSGRRDGPRRPPGPRATAGRGARGRPGRCTGPTRGPRARRAPAARSGGCR